jgi:membrane protein
MSRADAERPLGGDSNDGDADPQSQGASGDARGRQAESPTQIPARGWRDIAIRSWKEASTDNISLIAAGVAFYAFLSIVPLLGALVLTYGLVAEPSTVLEHIRALFALLPPEAASLIADQMIKISEQSANEAGLGLVVSLALALYGAMKGATAIVTALNIAYDEEEGRGFIRLNLMALAITIGAVVTGLTGIAAVAALAFLESLMPAAPPTMIPLLRLLFWCGAALVMAVGVATLYRYGPNRDQAKWRWLSPGAAFATIAWLIATLAFGIYTANFGNYDATYGALGAVVVLLMWLYLSAYILLFGAELNSEIEHQTAVDTTTGPEQPMGTRRAYVADTLGEVPAGLFGGGSRPQQAPSKPVADPPSAPAPAVASAPRRPPGPGPVHEPEVMARRQDRPPQEPVDRRAERGWRRMIVTIGILSIWDVARRRRRRGTGGA